MNAIQKAVTSVKSAANSINWAIIVTLIIAGVSVGIITFIIGMYLFCALAHVESAIRYARTFLWRS